MGPVILTFDLEYWFESLSVKKYLQGNEEDKLAEFTEKILEQLKKNNATATFFVTGRVLDNEPEIVKKINDAGQEIGLHSLDHQPLWRKTASDFQRDTKVLAEKITALTGRRPISHRAVNFSLDGSTSWALPILADNGIRFDSSIFPFSAPSFIFWLFKSKRYGDREGQVNPYRVNEIEEIPLAVFRGKKIRIPIAGGIYIRGIPWLIFKKLLAHKLKTEPACLYFHPFDFNDNPPPIAMPKIKKFIKYFNAAGTWQKLGYILKNFNCSSIEECHRTGSLLRK